MSTHESPQVPANCCGSNPTDNRPNDHAEKTRWAAAVAVAAAILSSACCWLPLVLLALGASAAGLSQFIISARWAFVAFALVSLGVGFYLSYRRNNSCAPGAACAPSGVARFNRVMLWISTILVLAMIAYPYYGGALLQALHRGGPQGSDHAALTPNVKGFDRPSGTAGAAGATTAHAGQATAPLMVYMYRIQGMDCSACAAGLQATIARLPGVDVASVSYQRGTAKVQAQSTFDPHKVVKLLDSVGYKTVLVKQGAAAPPQSAPAP